MQHVHMLLILYKPETPAARPFFWAQGKICTNLVEVDLGCYIPNIKALDLVVSDKIFSGFPFICLCKTCDPQGGAIFGPRGII